MLFVITGGRPVLGQAESAGSVRPPTANQQAMGRLRERLRIAPDDAVAWNGLGIALTVQGRVAEAAAYFMLALRLDPQHADAANNLAWILATHPDRRLRQGRVAIVWAERACQATERQFPNYLDTLAAAQAETGDFSAAAATLREALERAGEDDVMRRALESRQRLYASREAYRSVWNEGAEAFGRSLSSARDPQAMAAAVTRCRELIGNEWPNEWRRWAWTLATADDPRLRDAHWAETLAKEMIAAQEAPTASDFDTQAAAFAEAGRFDAALAVLDRWQRSPAADDISRAILQQRRVAFTGGLAVRDTSAVVAAEWGELAVRGSHASLSAAMLSSALNHRAAGRKGLARQVVQGAVLLDAESPQAQLLWAETLLAEGKWNEASRHLSAALWLRPSDAAALQRLAVAHERSGWSMAAVGCLDLAVLVAPEESELHEALAWRLATYPHPRIQNGPDAVRHAEQAARLAGARTTARLLDTLAAAQAANGDFKAAETAMAEAIEKWRQGATGGQEFTLSDLELRRELYRVQRPFSTPWVAHLDLAAARYREGLLQQAKQHFEEAARISGLLAQPPDGASAK